ncbi:two-component system, NtrC family, nitrogen regulation sensor histidine kinase GlnL [Aliiroseovarius sediminilitoris]|uniref:histidine kinase n=1 Tax=Aliiroseovarius sediminilitoris TaxID=1173584 RepID=A0A1I0PUL4_9RHOB|nr:ATP-binding protein [Aliiroseovarius sediminilitoris]SEW18148.1 two-component system, NtrC family, nitrogen regulation sensor histidine kinase GlnL [Aliiroseovarius sediminilitoris]
MSGDGHLWSALPVPAIELGEDGRVQRLNGTGEMFLNISERSLIGARLGVKIELSVDIDDALARVRSTGGPLYVDSAKLTLPGGDLREINVQFSPLTTPGGDKNHVLILLQPRNGAEHLGWVQGSQVAARQAIGMAEMLAHEIKNPLAGITGAAQLLSMSLSSEDRELTDLIVAESRRVVALLDQVEQFGDLRPPACAPVNIHDILDRARATAQIGFAPGMVISEAYDPSLPDVWVDGDQIQQVFLNLLKNAAQACKGEGKIEIHTYYEAGLRLHLPEGGQASLPLQVEVIDNGPGLPADIADHVFDPFVSGHENGTGLGLALVSKILTDHGALISVDSRPGRTAFRISLPVAPAPNRKGG